VKTLPVAVQDARFREALRAVPLRNTHVRATPLPEDPERLDVEVELLYRNAFQRLLRRLLHAAPSKHYKLDRLGTRVYRMIDGKKSFGELVDEFAAAEKLTFFESRALLGQFLQHLSRRGLVVAGIPKE